MARRIPRSCPWLVTWLGLEKWSVRGLQGAPLKGSLGVLEVPLKGSYKGL